MRETAKTQIVKAYEALVSTSYVRIMDILNVTDLAAADFSTAIRELYREGWSVIPNSQGGDVTLAERQYCPTIGAKQVHLIKK